MTDPLEAVTQRVAERVIDLVVQAVNVNDLVQRVDVNALLRRVDVDALLRQIDVDSLIDHVDVDRLLARVDVNALLARVDVDALVRQADLGAVIAESSGGVAREVLDGVRGHAVRMDGSVDRWARRLLRRKGTALSAPSMLLNPGTGT